MAEFLHTISIYSVGLLGGSLGSGLKNSGFKGRVIGLSSPTNLQSALDLGCIDEGYGYDKLPDIVKNTNLLVLCSPIQHIEKTLQQLGQIELPEGLIITDVGSTKAEIVAAAKQHLPSHVHFIGGHPMAGSEKSGASASDPYLFQNALYVLTPSESNPLPVDIDLAHFLEKFLGCRYLFLDPVVHDKIAATVSHVPHILAVALVKLAQKIEETTPGTLDLAAGGFRDMTRIASAPYSVWHDILATNKIAIDPLIDDIIGILQKMQQGLHDDALKEVFDKAQDVRAQIPSGNKGFISRLSEVLVIVKDQPGIIATIASELALQQINIKDIEVVKVREGEGGTIRLAFESPEIAQLAVSVLNKAGFSARERK